MSFTTQHSIKYAGKDFSDSDIGFTLTKVPRNLISSQDIPVNNVPSSDLSVLNEGYLQPKTIPIEGIIQGTGAQDVRDKLDELSKSLNPLDVLADNPRGENELKIWNYGDGRFWEAKLSSPVDPVFIGATAARVSWSFICSKPFSLGAVVNETFNIESDPDTFGPTVTGTGTPTDALFTINPIASAVLTQVKISNGNSGQTVVYGEQFTQNAGRTRRIRFNTFKKIIEILNPDVDPNYQPDVDNMSITGSFIGLIPGSNTIIVEDVTGTIPDPAFLDIDYTEHYLL